MGCLSSDPCIGLLSLVRLWEGNKRGWYSRLPSWVLLEPVMIIHSAKLWVWTIVHSARIATHAKRMPWAASELVNLWGGLQGSRRREDALLHGGRQRLDENHGDQRADGQERSEKGRSRRNPRVSTEIGRKKTYFTGPRQSWQNWQIWFQLKHYIRI